MHLKEKDISFEDTVLEDVQGHCTAFDQTHVGSGDAALTLHASQIRSKIHQGDARNLSFLPEASIDIIVTSPPYWRRRDYGHPEQLGQETIIRGEVRS